MMHGPFLFADKVERLEYEGAVCYRLTYRNARELEVACEVWEDTRMIVSARRSNAILVDASAVAVNG